MESNKGYLAIFIGCGLAHNHVYTIQSALSMTVGPSSVLVWMAVVLLQNCQCKFVFFELVIMLLTTTVYLNMKTKTHLLKYQLPLI